MRGVDTVTGIWLDNPMNNTDRNWAAELATLGASDAALDAAVEAVRGWWTPAHGDFWMWVYAEVRG